MSRAAFRCALLEQRVCAVSGKGGAWHGHHAVRESDVRDGDPHDPRNALRLGVLVHFRHHAKFERVPMSALTDENIDFAFEIFGDYAHDYLHQHYGGSDQRVSSRLQAQA